MRDEENMFINNNFGRLENVVKRGDIVLCDLGFGEGSEQSGIRPCVVIQNDKGNRYSTTLIVAAITSSSSKAKMPTHIEIDEKCGLDKASVILCEQIRTIDKNRVKKFIGSVNRDVREKIDKALMVSVEVFKNGELAVKEQAVKVKSIEETLISIYDICNDKDTIEKIIFTYKLEYQLLENMCKKYRLYMKYYYNKSEQIESILKEEERNKVLEPKLRVVV